MKKVNLSQFSVGEVKEHYGINNNSDFDKTGLYKIHLGSRGYVEDVVFVQTENELEVYEDQQDLENYFDLDFPDFEFDEEFCGVYDYMFNEKQVFGVSLLEEWSIEYVYVVV